MEIQEAVRQVRPGWRREALQGGVCQHDDEGPQVDQLQDLLLIDPLHQQDRSFNPIVFFYEFSVAPHHLLYLLLIDPHHQQQDSSFYPFVFFYEFFIAPDHL